MMSDSKSRPVMFTDPGSGKRYRIEPIRKYFERPNMAVSRQEMGELVALLNHNMRVRRPWWRATRFMAAVFGFKKVAKKLTPKGAIKLFVADK